MRSDRLTHDLAALVTLTLLHSTYTDDWGGSHRAKLAT